MNRPKLLLVLASLSLAGCSVHPEPEDFSGVPTNYIVRQIRCETRDAVRATIVEFLTDPKNLREGRVDEKSEKIGEDLYYKRLDYRDFRVNMLDGKALLIVELVMKTGVADNYNLQMTETNNNDGNIDFLGGVVTSGRFLGVTSKLDLARQNTRIFTTTDTFGKLVNSLSDDFCREFVKDKNIIYPMTGEIGIEPVIHTFIQLAVYDGLAGDASKDPSNPSGPAQMAEQLQFTTTLSLSANPHVLFAPATHNFHVLDASFTAGATRVDLHKLTMGLYVPKGERLDAIRGGIFGSAEVPVASSLATLASAPVANDAERGALAAVNQALTLGLFQSTTQVILP